MSFTPELSSMPVMLAAKLDVGTLMFIGAMATAVATVFSYSNWRLGVKIAFTMVLIEGGLRKWVIPGAQELAYFAKDIFLVGAYLRFFMFPDPELRAYRLRLPGGLIALCCVIVSFSSLNPNIGSPVLAAYGLKIYLFYLPLVFMMPYLFRTRKDLENGLFYFAMMSVPVCLLGFAQYAMPGDNWLNVYAHGTEGTSMGWEGSKIRVTGTFSYISGHTTFLVIFFALHLALLVNKLTKWKWICLLCNLPLLAGNALMNGSRTAVFAFAFIGSGFLLLSFFMKVGDGGNMVLRIGFLSILISLAVRFFFVEAQSQYTQRSQSAGDGIYYRAVGMSLTAVDFALKQGGAFGFGIGMTHPALERIRSALKIPKPKRIPPTYDNEAGQVLVELGVVGWGAWYILRFLLVS